MGRYPKITLDIVVEKRKGAIRKILSVRSTTEKAQRRK